MGRQHWEGIYRKRADDQLSWFEADPALSLAFISEACPDPAT